MKDTGPNAAGQTNGSSGKTSQAGAGRETSQRRLQQLSELRGNHDDAHAWSAQHTTTSERAGFFSQYRVHTDFAPIHSRELSPTVIPMDQGDSSSVPSDAATGRSPAASRSHSVSQQSATVAAQQCQAPPVPTCNASAAFQAWEPILEELNLELVVLLSCEVFMQAGEATAVQYPAVKEPLESTPSEIAGVPVVEVW